MLTILLDIGSNINIVGLETAQTFEQVSRSRGRATKKLNGAKRPYVSGVGHGTAHCARGKGGPAGAPAVPRLDTYSANVAEGSGGNLLAILGQRSMSNMRTILSWSRGARVFDLMKTPPGHLALEVDEYGAATEDKRSTSITVA
eukprot:6483437-Pyramimonas_sp.AAC.1